VASVAPRYARAFAQVAESEHLDAAQAQQQMRDFAETLAGSFELRELLADPSILLSQKLKVLDAMAGKIGMSPQVRNFLAVILEHHRLSELKEIIEQYREIADAHADAVEASITSAYALHPEDKAQLEAQVAKLAGAKVKASYVEDPTLLGGAIVQIGSTIYDGSVRAQLQQLRQRLVNA
jgi:F-type H+-transporting ATPase subunit delta